VLLKPFGYATADIIRFFLLPDEHRPFQRRHRPDGRDADGTEDETE
jgi:hypothetical protein